MRKTSVAARAAAFEEKQQMMRNAELLKQNQKLTDLYKNLAVQLDIDEYTDFDIPSKWKPKIIHDNPSKSLSRIYPKYKVILKNFYRPPLHRLTCDIDFIPPCCCEPATGCNESCQNRLLFM